jgi:hypothetical protein
MNNPNTAPEMIAEIEMVVEAIKPLLAGRSPEVQGAVLADLVSILIVGHHPTLREEILRLHIESVRQLIKPNEQLLFPNGTPREWSSVVQ